LSDTVPHTPQGKGIDCMALFQRGSQGPEVAKIQTRLQELGLYAGPIDGECGGLDSTLGGGRSGRAALQLVRRTSVAKRGVGDRSR
jgi:hypothetical protein